VTDSPAPRSSWALPVSLVLAALVLLLTGLAPNGHRAKGCYDPAHPDPSGSVLEMTLIGTVMHHLVTWNAGNGHCEHLDPRL